MAHSPSDGPRTPEPAPGGRTRSGRRPVPRRRHRGRHGPAAHLSQAHFSRAFRTAFGESPHQYLLTRRLERAAALLRDTDWPVARICVGVGLQSVGSFTTSFRRMFGTTPTRYRAAHPPAAGHAQVPECVRRVYGRPAVRTFREDAPDGGA